MFGLGILHSYNVSMTCILSFLGYLVHDAPFAWVLTSDRMQFYNVYIVL